MKSSEHTKRTTLKILFGGLVALIATQTSFAQDDDSEEVFELSPFIVNESGNQGYRATNTLAGSRLDSSINDLGSSIDVVTNEMMDDLALTNVLDAAEWVGNVTSDRGGMAISDPEGNTAFNTGRNLRIRGFATANQKQDFFPLAHVSDRYNVERLTFARGPNAILFGLGSPGGVVNTASKRAKMKDGYEVKARFDSFGSQRFEVDLNQAIIEDKLALRFAAVEEVTETFRKPETGENSRQYLAFGYRPNEKTNIHISYEEGEIRRSGGRSWLVADGISLWEEAGAPLVAANNLHAAGNRPEGIANLHNQRYLLFVDTEATGVGTDIPILNWRRYGAAQKPSRPFADSRGNTSLLDESILPHTANVMGDANQSFHDFDHLLVSWEQRVIKGLDLQLAYNKQSELTDTFRTVPNVRYILYPDVNQFLPSSSAFGNNAVSSTPNPNVYNPNDPFYYFETDNFELLENSDEYEILRGAISYELNFSEIGEDSWLKHLGDHRIAAMFESEDYHFERINNWLQNATPLPGYPVSPFHAQNRIRMRWYLDADQGVFGPQSDWTSRFPVRHRGETIPADTDGDGIVPVFAPRNNGVLREAQTDSQMYVAQSRFLNNRLITTVGWRIDSTTQYSGDARGPNPGDIVTTPDNPWLVSPRGTFSASNVFDPQDFEDVRTWTRGAVFKLFDNAGPIQDFRVFFNQSRSGNVGTGPTDIFGVPLPASTGDGKDWGFRFAALESKLYVNVNFFESTEFNKNQVQIRGGVLTGPFSVPVINVWETLLENNLAEEVKAGSGVPIIGGRENETFRTWQDKADFASEGFEINLTYNPNSAMRLRATISHQENVVDNFGEIAMGYFDQFNAYMQTRQDLLSMPIFEGNGDTIADELTLAGTSLENDRRLNGITDGRQPLYKVSLIANYDFRNHDGWIKPFSVGVGAQWRDENAIGYALDENGAIITGQPLTEQTPINLDLWIKYQQKIMNDKARWTTQVNVKNALNEDDLIAQNANAGLNGERIVVRWRPPVPIHLVVSTGIKF